VFHIRQSPRHLRHSSRGLREHHRQRGIGVNALLQDLINCCWWRSDRAAARHTRVGAVSHTPTSIPWIPCRTAHRVPWLCRVLVTQHTLKSFWIDFQLHQCSCQRMAKVVKAEASLPFHGNHPSADSKVCQGERLRIFQREAERQKAAVRVRHGAEILAPRSLGVRMGRRSILHVHVVGQDGADGIEVGGYVTPVAEATMRLDGRK